MIRLAAFLGLSPITGIAGAQTLEPPGAIRQIAPSAPPADDMRSSQVAIPARSVRTPAPATSRSALPPPQLGNAHDARPPAQLVAETRTGRAPAQLSHGPASALPPAPLSRPADGRTAAVARVNGQDRCDAAARRKADVDCRAVIETRARDFPPPVPTPLSPEQRLLVEQRPPGPQGPAGEAIARTATRGAARDAVDPAAPSVQGVASVYLGTATPPRTPVDPTAGLTPDQAAAATAVLGAIAAPRP